MPPLGRQFQAWGEDPKTGTVPEIDMEAFPNKIDRNATYRLYRGVGLRVGERIRNENVGTHWTYDRKAADIFAREEGMAPWGGGERDPSETPTVLEADVRGADLVDWLDPANESLYEEHAAYTPNYEAEVLVRPGAHLAARRVHNLREGTTEELLYDRWKV